MAVTLKDALVQYLAAVEDRRQVESRAAAAVYSRFTFDYQVEQAAVDLIRTEDTHAKARIELRKAVRDAKGALVLTKPPSEEE